MEAEGKMGGGGMCVYLSTVIKKSAFLQVLLYSYSIGTMREFRDFKQFCSHSRLNSSKKATAILCLGIYILQYYICTNYGICGSIIRIVGSENPVTFPQ